VKKIVLLGEGSQTVRAAIEMVLRHENDLEIQSFSNGDALLAAYAASSPNLVFCSTELASSSGENVLSKICGGMLGLTVIVQLHHAEPKALQGASNLKLKKPFNSDQLLSVTREALSHVSALEPVSLADFEAVGGAQEKPVALDKYSLGPDLEEAGSIESPSEAFLSVENKGVAGISREEIMALTKKVVEEVVWEVVPKLAESLIKEEIAKLKDD